MKLEDGQTEDQQDVGLQAEETAACAQKAAQPQEGGKLPLLLDLRFPLSPRYDEHLENGTLKGGAGPCEAYVKALDKEIAATASDFQGYKVVAVRLEGGIPSMMTGTQLRSIMRAIRGGFDFDPGTEFLLRVGPRLLSADLLSSRLSTFKLVLEFDAVSSVGKELRALGEYFDFGTIQDTMELLRCLDLREFSVDLRYGLFYQTEKTMRQSLDEVSALEPVSPTRISLLPYKLRPDGDCAKLVEKGELPAPDPALAEELFRAGDEHVQTLGFAPYARGRYALPGHESAWWKAYREGAAVLGCGLGARSRFEEFETKNTLNFKAYVEHPDDISVTCASSRLLSEEEIAAEHAARLSE